MKCIFLDIGEVLMRKQDLRRGIKRLEKRFGVDPTIRYHAIWGIAPEMDSGKKTFQDAIDRINTQMKRKNKDYHPITIKDYYATMYDSKSYNIQLVNFFKKISGRATICIFTNNYQTNIDKYMTLLDFGSWADYVISSHQYHIGKPDAKFFRIAFKKTRAKPQECMLVDDNPANIATAEALGMHVCLHSNNARTIREITAWLKD